MSTAHAFVDTNVFVYARQAREVEKQPVAAQWIDRLWREQTGRTSIQVLSECYVTLMRRLEPVLHRAFEIEQRHRLNWWDCQIVASAQLQGCSVLLTEDLQDGAMFSGVTVRNPFTLSVSEELAAYVTTGLEPPPYPRRGRPVRTRA